MAHSLFVARCSVLCRAVAHQFWRYVHEWPAFSAFFADQLHWYAANNMLPHALSSAILMVFLRPEAPAGECLGGIVEEL